MQYLLISISILFVASCGSTGSIKTYDSLSGNWEPRMGSKLTKFNYHRDFKKKFKDTEKEKLRRELFNNQAVWKKISAAYTTDPDKTCGNASGMKEWYNAVDKDFKEAESEYEIIDSNCKDGTQQILRAQTDGRTVSTHTAGMDTEFRSFSHCLGQVKDGKIDGKLYCSNNSRSYSNKHNQIVYTYRTRSITIYKNGMQHGLSVTATDQNVLESYHQRVFGATADKTHIYTIYAEEFQNGRFHGTRNVYKHGKVSLIGGYKSGISHGVHQSFDNKGRLTSSLNYVDGVVSQAGLKKNTQLILENIDRKNDEEHGEDWSLD